MALIPPDAPQERRASPPAPLVLNFNSNNPFRNRANSPAINSPASLPTPATNSARPVSSNPFLSAFEAATNNNLQAMSAGDTTARTTSPQATSGAKEAFDNLTLNEKPAQNGASHVGPPKRSETLPHSGHRPSGSDEVNGPRPNGGRRPSRPRIPPSANDPFASPERRERRDYNGPGRGPMRRNSESSVRSANRPMTEEERRAREQRRRDRERRHRERAERDRDGKPRDKSGRPRKPNAGLDLIDKLDVTGIYGPSLFHHDGPFDACNPHRNRKKDYRAPMQAFPANSKNNTIGGSGPVNQKLDMDRIRGVGPEGYEDFAHIGPNATAEGFQAQSGHKLSFEKEANTLSDPYAKTELQHGEESLGLGTSTFLEGAPAPKSAMQRRESDNETSTYANGAGAANGGGLGRKKSLVQRIRGMSQPKREYQYGAGAVNSPTSPDSPPRKGSVSGTVRPVYPASAGGRITQVGDTSPFFNEYDDAFEKKGASIRVAEQESGTSKELPTQRRREPSSPRRGPALERRTTGDGGEEGFTFTRPVLNDGRGPPPSMNGVAAVNAAIQNGTAPGGGGGGFLNRVKSLKGRNKAKAQA